MKKLFIIALFLLTARFSLLTVAAQGTPGTVRCPTNADTLDSLFRVTDSARTNLSGAIAANATSIPVLSTSVFPSSGSIKIDAEVIYYTSKTATTFEGLVRGASGTTAASHGNNALVQSPILSAHHNTLAAAIICAQEKALAAQAADADLAAIAALSPANDDVIQRKSNSWINRTIAQLKTDLVLTKSDVGLSNVDNTSDAAKPISTATQSALDAKVPTTRTVNGHVLSTNVTIVKSDIGLGNVDNTSDGNKPVSTAQQTALDAKVDENAAIAGATKTKITYDAKGLVTAGADATTADVADSADKRYVTDAQRTVIQNTSGINTGDQDMSSLATKAGIQAASYSSCSDAGSTDAYACSLSPAIASYTNVIAWVKVNTANTGAATLNLSSVGAITIKKQKDQDLADNDFKPDQWILVGYDGTFWQLLSPVSNTAAGGIGSINGDTTPAQVLAAGTGVSVTESGATHTIGLTGEVLLATVTGVNLNTAIPQDVYTVPAGKTLIVTMVIFSDPSPNGFNGGETTQMRVLESSGGAVIATVAISGSISELSSFLVATTTNAGRVITAGNKVQVRPDAPYESAETYTVRVFGILF